MGLMDFLQNIPTANELNGSFGEYLTKFYSKATTDALVLHDVLIDGADGHTSQIDLILIGHTGIYVVEVKSFMDATIYGDGYKSQWYYYLHGHKYTIYSPLRQNKKHLEYLKTFLQDFGDIPFFSVVVMLCKDFKISNIDPDPKNRTTMVCSSLPAMGRALRALSQNRPDVLDDAAKQAVFEHISSHQRQGKEARREHKKQVMEYKQKQAEEETQNICPYCKSPLVHRSGKYGSFWGCSNYPKCRFTRKP